MEEQNQDVPAEAGQSENKETISLGGNITLNGFQNIETAKMIVLKKMIGNYVKQIQEKKSDYEKITFTLEGDEGNCKVSVELLAGGSPTLVEETTNNIFTSTDSALKKLLDQI